LHIVLRHINNSGINKYDVAHKISFPAEYFKGQNDILSVVLFSQVSRKFKINIINIIVKNNLLKIP